MGLVTTNLSAFVKENSAELIQKAVLSAKTLEVIKKQPGVKGSAYINLIDSDVTLQAGTCGWNPNGSINVSNRTIATSLIKVQDAYCEKTLAGTSLEWGMKVSNGSVSNDTPLEGYIVDSILKGVAKANEDLVWQGVKGSTDVAANLRHIDGFIAILGATGSGVVDATDATALAPLTNAKTVIGKVVDAIPSALLSTDDLAVFVGPDVFRAYVNEITAANLYHAVVSLDGKSMELVIPFTNIKMIAVNGLNGTKKIYAGQASNFVAGMDLEGDDTKLTFEFESYDQQYHFNLFYNLGVQVAYPSEIVQYLGV